MQTFLAPARDGMANQSCNTCCCERASIKPGEIAAFAINYAHWVAPIGGYGLTANTWFHLERIGPDLPPGVNAPPINSDKFVRMSVNTVAAGTVATGAIDPEAAVMQFAHVPQWGPRNGTLAMLTDGSYTYTPRLGYVGYDDFTFSTSDGINAPVLNRVRIVIDPVLPTPELPAPIVHPVLRVVQGSASIRGTVLRFAMQAAQELRVGDVYRLTVHQDASDCDQVYRQTMCVDVTAVKC